MRFVDRTRCDQRMVKGGGEEEGEMKKKNSSPSLFVIRRLNPICDSPVSAGDRIELSR